MNEIITSRQNSLCKLARSLHHAKYRRKQGLFFIEGENAVHSAMQAKWELTAIFADSSNLHAATTQMMAHSYDLKLLHPLQSSVLQSICETQTSPKIAAIARYKSTFGDTVWQCAKVLLVLDNVADPGNVGTLLRAADASGADGVLLLGNCVDHFSSKVIRASAGSIFHLPILHLDIKVLLEKAHQYNFDIIAASAHDGVNCHEFHWPQKYFLVLGNEKHGISQELSVASDHRLTIPIKGRAESLNVAMAGTVLLFAHRHQAKTKIAIFPTYSQRLKSRPGG